MTKDHPKNGPEELLTMIDRRLENLGIDYVDMLLHPRNRPQIVWRRFPALAKERSLRKVFDN